MLPTTYLQAQSPSSLQTYHNATTEREDFVRGTSLPPILNPTVTDPQPSHQPILNPTVTDPQPSHQLSATQFLFPPVEHGDVSTSAYLQAAKRLSETLDCVGTVFYFQKRDQLANLQVIEKHFQESPDRFCTLLNMLYFSNSVSPDTSIPDSTTITVPLLNKTFTLPKWRQPQSLVDALLGLNRGHLFIVQFLKKLAVLAPTGMGTSSGGPSLSQGLFNMLPDIITNTVTRHNKSPLPLTMPSPAEGDFRLSELLMESYEETLKVHHTWLQQNLFMLAIRSCQATRNSFLKAFAAQCQIDRSIRGPDWEILQQLQAVADSAELVVQLIQRELLSRNCI